MSTSSFIIEKNFQYPFTTKVGLGKLMLSYTMRVVTEVRDFFAQTTIHGFAYLGQSRSHWTIKLVIALMILVLFGTGFLVISFSMENWKVNPVLITIDSLDKLAMHIQFPTVTVCHKGPYDRWGPIEATMNQVCDHLKPPSYCPSLWSGLLPLLELKNWKILDLIVEKIDLGEYDIQEKDFLDEVRRHLGEALEDPHFTLELDYLVLYRDVKRIRQLIDPHGILEMKGVFNLSSSYDPSDLQITKDIDPYVKMLLSKAMALVALPTLDLPLSDIIPDLDLPSLCNPGQEIDPQFPISIGEEEASAHQVFANMWMNFTDNNVSISLFEIPKIMDVDDYPKFEPDPSNYHRTPIWSMLNNKKAADGVEDKRLIMTTLQKHFPTLFKFMLRSVRAKQQDFKALRNHKMELVHVVKSTGVADFATSITDMGICSSYNAQSMIKAFNESPFINLFTHNVLVNESSAIVNNSMSGLQFLILTNQAMRSGDNGHEFVISFNSQFDFFDTMSMSFEVKSGFIYRFRVIPKEFIATTSFKNMPKTSRKCLYLDENPQKNSMFTYYTQKSCQFECRLSMSFMVLGCYPWYYPRPAAPDSMPLCDGQESFRFNAYFKAVNADEDCHCPANCEEVVFEVQESATPIEIGRECLRSKRVAKDESKPSLFAIIQRFMESTHQTFLKVIGTQLVTADLLTIRRDIKLEEEMPMEFCERAIRENFALIHVETGVTTVQTIKREPRVTFSDQLGTLGGTLGLFTGMSLFGVFEVIYWLYRVIIFALLYPVAQKLMSSRVGVDGHG